MQKIRIFRVKDFYIFIYKLNIAIQIFKIMKLKINKN